MELLKFLKKNTIDLLPRVAYVNYDSVGVNLRGGDIMLTFDFLTNDSFRSSEKTMSDYRRCQISWTVTRVGILPESHKSENIKPTTATDPEIAKFLRITTSELRSSGRIATEAFLKGFRDRGKTQVTI